ncbi:uncharacterized protein METZ01_LOCUS364782, partial [marine metagenome]
MLRSMTAYGQFRHTKNQGEAISVPISFNFGWSSRILARVSS